MDEAIRLLGDSELNLQSIVTHEVPFIEWEDAFLTAEKNKDGCLKVSMII
jgi:threonine dehydrogenase-like Zn-dependent dehydrogenase